MSTSRKRKKWWSYIKEIIREYPDTDTEDERNAVAAAIAQTMELPDGQDRLKVIELVFWKETHRIVGAAMLVPCSERTAQQWHGDFIRLVAKNYKTSGLE